MDIALAIILVKYSINGFKYNKKDIKKVSVIVVVFATVGLLSIYRDYFNIPSYINNTIRLTFYALVFVMLSYRARIETYNIRNNHIRLIQLMFLLTMIEYILINSGYYYSYDSLSVSAKSIIGIRPSAVFSEPSFLSIFIILSYSILLKLQTRGYYWRFMAILTVLLSQSLSGIMGIIIITYFDNVMWNKVRKIKIFVYTIFATIIIITGSIFFLERIYEIVSGIDGSTNHRIFGSLEVFYTLIEQNILFGIGLGQWQSWLKSAYFGWEYHFFMASIETGSGINNALVMATGIGGIFGLFSYLYFIASISKNKHFLFVTMWLSFSWGYILHPFVFYYLGIINGLENINNNITHQKYYHK